MAQRATPTTGMENDACSNCGATLGRHEPRCSFCGTDYSLAPNARFLLALPGGQVVVRCPSCYSLVPVETECTACKRPLPHVTTCPECGQFAPLARNCNQCGGLLAEDADLKEGEHKKSHSFVQEIETIARRRLAAAGYPEPVLLYEKAQGDLEIIVGDKAYPGIQAIPDKRLRHEFELAAEEWQTSTSSV